MDERLGTTNAPDVHFISSIRPRMKSKGLVAVDIPKPPIVVRDVDARVVEGVVRRGLLCDQIVLIGDLHCGLGIRRGVNRLSPTVDTSPPPCFLVAPATTVVEAQEMRIRGDG